MKILVGYTPNPEGVAALDLAEGHAKLVDEHLTMLVTGSTAQAVLLNSPVPVIRVPGQPKTG